jgi:hypothetical protein
MESLSRWLPRQFGRAGATAALTGVLCVAFHPEPAEAQVRTAVRLLGDFVVAVVSGIVVDRTKATESSEPLGYRIELKWVMEGGTYRGTLEMRGDAGMFRVKTPAGLLIDEGMTATFGIDRNELWLLASHPRYAGTSEFVSPDYYNPDNFRLTRSDSGWAIHDICHLVQPRCAPVDVVAGRRL